MKKFLLIVAAFSIPVFGLTAAMNAQELRNDGSYQNYSKGRSGGQWSAFDGHSWSCLFK